MSQHDKLFNQRLKSIKLLCEVYSLKAKYTGKTLMIYDLNETLQSFWTYDQVIGNEVQL